jgi:hypothetical protein
MSTAAPDIPQVANSSKEEIKTPAFGSNELRLNAQEWLISIGIVLTCMLVMPRIWKAVERLSPGSDYRIPYTLSKDYWLYQRRIEQVAKPGKVLILGDSVVWGEYVRPDGTLSHFLNAQTPPHDRFVNCGVNGLFPLAMEGLVQNYGRAIHDNKVIVHYNVLWMTSPKADLSEKRPQNFNHSRLVPQFFPRIPSYGADANERLSALLDQHIPYFAWTAHLQNAYYDQKSIALWTLEDDGNEPPNYPNAWKNPISPLRSGIQSEPAVDPLRGPTSPRHRPWNAGGAEPTSFDWVALDESLQWKAFQRTLLLLRSRGNQVLVIFGPFNEHMIAPDQVPTFHAMRDQIVAWLRTNGFSVVVPETLPSTLYADASHPLTQGYALLASQLVRDSQFQRFASADVSEGAP